MKYEKNDVNELYESINVDANFYVEIKENEYLTKIKNKWPVSYTHLTLPTIYSV